MEPDRSAANLDLPIACSLTLDELVAMRDGLLPGLLAKANAQESIPGGFRWRFEPTLDMAKEIGAVIDAEIAAARFYAFF